MTYSLGVDFGTNSVRVLIVDCQNGTEIAVSSVDYPSGEQGILLDPADHNLARQNPCDYFSCLENAVKSAIASAKKNPAFSPDKIIAMGVAGTGSSPLPVDALNRPLAMQSAWQNNLSAQCWLWKDHTSFREAETITKLAAEIRPEYIAKCGNTYSSEWFWSKILHCFNVSPDVFAAAHSWVELSDYIPSVLAGVSNPLKIKRGVCAAGHKALYCDEEGAWGGLPDKEFLSKLSPELASLRDRLYEKAYDASTAAGNLCEEWAVKLGLVPGIPIAIGELDVHYGAIGSGIEEGVIVKSIGTSTCDCAVMSAERTVPQIDGICGIVKGAILPGFYGVEAGQSAVGDILKWFVEVVCQGNPQLHFELSHEVMAQSPGRSGLVALDWNNGNRNILVDPLLSGLILGQTLHTSRAEIYRALIEATAFGARAIIERLTEYGVPVEKIICCGGIAEKNPFFMQIYADVIGCDILLAGSSQACALGAAVSASVLAGKAKGGHDNIKEAQQNMTSLKDIVFKPKTENRETYNKLYSIYKQLHDAFGGINRNADLSQVMKELILLKTCNQTVSSSSSCAEPATCC
ncbi:MAG: ribulokinase [Candidatus Obscuribacterales bacterium]|nr:ribulokinase [Candidatus Obscuribacterales bacterium]